MTFRNDPGCCCTPGGSCCTGGIPSQYQAVIANWANGSLCAFCGNNNGTYILDRVDPPTSGLCEWLKQVNGIYCLNDVNVKVQLFMFSDHWRVLQYNSNAHWQAQWRLTTTLRACACTSLDIPFHSYIETLPVPPGQTICIGANTTCTLTSL